MGSKSRKDHAVDKRKSLLKGKLWHQLQRFRKFEGITFDNFLFTFRFPNAYFYCIVGIDAKTGQPQGALDGKKFWTRRSAMKYANKNNLVVSGLISGNKKLERKDK